MSSTGWHDIWLTRSPKSSKFLFGLHFLSALISLLLWQTVELILGIRLLEAGQFAIHQPQHQLDQGGSIRHKTLPDILSLANFHRQSRVLKKVG